MMRMSENEYEDLLRSRGMEPEESEKSKKPSKYHSKRVKVDGILFDSQKEADYYSDLKIQLQAGVIKGFCRQPEFVLLAGFAKQRPETYRADFIVFNLDGTAEIVDTKGVETEVFKIKHKQFRAKFPGLELEIVK